MTKGYWFATAGTLALLAAGPVFAQSRPGDSGMMNESANSGSMGTQSDNGSTNSSGSNGSMNHSAQPGSMGTHSDNGMGMHSDAGTMESSSQNRGAMHAARTGQTDASQNAEVDRLNEESYQAAQQGRQFTPGHAGSSGMGR